MNGNVRISYSAYFFRNLPVARQKRRTTVGIPLRSSRECIVEAAREERVSRGVRPRARK